MPGCTRPRDERPHPLQHELATVEVGIRVLDESFHTAGWFLYPRTRGGIHGTDTHSTQNAHRITHDTRHTTHDTRHTTHDTRHTVHRTQHTAHSTQRTAPHTHTHKTGRHGQPHNRICCTIHNKSVLSFEQEAAVRRGFSRHRAKDVSATIELVLQRLLARLLHQTAGTNISQLLMLDVHDPTA